MTIPTSLSLLIIVVIFANDDVSAVSKHEKLLIISYDAFRYDYFNRNITPFMNELRNNGTHSEYMKNIFVTKTFPNHYTMATGLYAETHGVVGNQIYDPRTGKVENDSYAMYHYNDKIAPIWIINEKESPDRHSGVMMWPGCRYPYLDTYPTFYQGFNDSLAWETRVDRVISWFVHPETPINLGILYIEEPDEIGHALGINSPAFNAVLEKLDHLTKYIYDKLEEHSLNDVNVVHLSDHGMQVITKDRIIDLNQFVNQSDYSIVASSAGLQIFPINGKFDTVYQQLAEGAKRNGHFKVYKKEEIPEKYHFGNNPRIAPIFIVADIRYAFNDVYADIKYYEEKYNFTSNNQSEFGVHGYDNGELDMQPMFFAYGPIFKKHYKLEPFNNTDLFPLFCEILDLSCPPSNGTLENVKSCLTTTNHKSTFFMVLSWLTFSIILVSSVPMAVFICKRKLKEAKTDYRTLPTESDRESHLQAGDSDSDMA